VSESSLSPIVSVTLTSSLDTIEVGAPGTFNSDAEIDISSELNAALASAAPNNTLNLANNIPINVVFNPGDYGVLNNIVLQPDATVIGLSDPGLGTPETAELNFLTMASSLVTSTLSSSLDTIVVGATGGTNADANVDISAALNAALRAAPTGVSIEVVFNPGSYGAMDTILLPSNTTVIGNNAMLSFLPNTNSPGSTNIGALMSNADTYYSSINPDLLNPNGTYSQVIYKPGNTARIASTYSAILQNTNISVSGLTFNETGIGGNGFGTWFSNASNINVSNNLYIGGNDGNAFVNVDGGIVADNTAIGEIYSFDNWNGTSNVTIINNEVWQNSVNDDSTSAALQINSSPNGDTVTSDPGYNGDDYNDALIGNNVAGNSAVQSAINVLPLTTSDKTSIDQVVVDGNIDTSLGGETQGIYTQGALSNLQITNNVVTGAILAPIGSGSWNGIIDAFPGLGTISNVQISGNLIYGATVAGSNSTVINNDGTSSKTAQNDISSETFVDLISGTIDNQTSTSSFIASNSLNLTSPTLLVSSPNVIQMGSNSQLLTNIVVADNVNSALLNVTVSAEYGSISSNGSSVTGTVNFAGSLSTINQDLESLSYTPSRSYEYFDDIIKVISSDNFGDQYTSFILVSNNNLSSELNNVVTISAGFIVPSAPYTEFSSLLGSVPPSLTGDIQIATSGNNVISMTTVTSIAYLGSGYDTVYGGSDAGYVVAGSGTSLIDLTGGGNVTFVGGSGNSTIDALTGDNILEGASGLIAIIGGAANLTVIGGTGSLNYQGGSGTTDITTLPQDGGDSSIELGTGNSTVEAFSGNDIISSELGTTNDLSLGSGNDSVNSAGNDYIYAGIGNDSIELSASAADTVIGGGGNITVEFEDKAVSFTGVMGVQYLISQIADSGTASLVQLFNGALSLSARNSTINTALFTSVTDTIGGNVLSVSDTSLINIIAGNDIVQVTAGTSLFNSSISGTQAANTINFANDDNYDASDSDFISSKNILNLFGNDAAVIYAANQDTVNLIGSANVLFLQKNSTVSDRATTTMAVAGASVVNVDGLSTALVETAGNDITGENGAQLIVTAGNNTITGQNLNAELSGAGDIVVLTGSDTLSCASPYSYLTSPSQAVVQNQVTVQSGQFTMGGLDTLDQVSGSAGISLFGGNRVTLGGTNDSVTVSDQVYGGNAIMNDGVGNVLTLLNTNNAATTITAVASTLVNVSDNSGTVIGATNNNSDEKLTFVAGSGTSNTIWGAGSNTAITLFGGQSTGNVVYGGATGVNSLNGGSGGRDYFQAGGTGDVLIGGAAGNNTLTSSAGLETLVGSGLGTDIISIAGGGGIDMIQNFTGSLIVNSSLTVTSKTNVSGSLVFKLSDQTQIVFVGVAKLNEVGNVFHSM
jgi:hypothetical protein